jgi:hypothetical protein
MACVPVIGDLVALVPPPAEPVDANGEWDQIEASLGTRLPADFEALIERYGSGMFVDFIRPCTPFGSWASLVQRARNLLDRMGPARDNWPDLFPYPFYPEPRVAAVGRHRHRGQSVLAHGGATGHLACRGVAAPR